MSQLSYVSGELHLQLDDSHKRNRIILSPLKNTIGFKEREGILVLRKSDAKTILRVKKIVPNLILDKKCEQIIKEYRETEANFETLLEEGRKIKEKPDAEFEDFQVPEFDSGKKLEPYQLKPVKHANTVINSANFTVPGGGKTWMALATYFLAKAEGKFPIVNNLLVICPLSAFQVWEEEYGIITGNDPKQHIVRITKQHLERAIIPLLPQRSEIMLINYDKIGDRRFNAALQILLEQNNIFVILDESHKIKTYDAERGIGARDLAPFAKRRMILTGTPMPNFHRDLWNQFNFLFPNRNILGHYESYLRKIESEQGQKDVIEFLWPLFTRVTEHQLNLPGFKITEIPCTMTSFQEKIYETIAWDIVQNFQNRNMFEALSDFEKKMMYLLEASTDPALLEKDNQYYEDLIDLNDIPVDDWLKEYGKGEKSGKMEVLQKLLENLVPKREKIIVWCNFTATIEKVEDMLKKGVFANSNVQTRIINGEIDKDDATNPEENKEKSLREFKTDPNCNILIANPASLAESVSLHKVCHKAIYVDRTYNAAHWIQSKKRIHRIGTKKGDTEYIILKSKYAGDDKAITIDDKIDERLNKKEKLQNEFLGDPGLQVNHSMLDWSKLNDSDAEEDYKGLLSFLRGKFDGQTN